MRTRITARWVVGYADGDHVIYPDGQVVVDDDRIAFVGHGDESPVDRTIDAGEALVGPGFVDLNALADIDHAIFDSWQPPERSPGLQWSEAYFANGRRDVFDRATQAFNRRYALVQLLRHGVTTALPIAAETYKAWAETEAEFTDLAAIATELGLRLYAGPSYRDGVPVTRADGTADVLFDAEEGRRNFAEAERFARALAAADDGDALVRPMLAPARIQTVTLDTLRRSRALSDELGCPLRLHAAQGLEEVEILAARHGKRPIELLDEIGFLGPRTLIPHAWAVAGHSRMGAYGEGDDLGLLADSGTTVIFCPIASAHYGIVLESFDRYRERGINVGIGTDTFPSDPIRALDYALLMTKAVEPGRPSDRAAELYRSATLAGARALGRDDLGRLAPGAKADLTVIDLSGLDTGPVADPIRTLIMNGSGSCVRTVMVDGRIVVEDGEVPGIDIEALRVGAQEFFDAYQDSFTERDHLGRSRDELFPSSFKVVTR